jgi:DNA polymerase-1
MNIPKKYRPIFLPDSGYWTRFDCSMQEIRILAKISGDRKMQAVIERYDETGDPALRFHAVTAELMGCSYDDGKTTTFTTIYGGGDETIASRAKTTKEKGGQLRSLWARAYPDAWAWMEAVKVVGLRQGYVETLDGRKLWLPDPATDFEGEEGVGRKAVNFPIQGTGGSVLRQATIVLDEAEESPYYSGIDLRIPVHDELDNDGVMVDHPNLDNLIEGLYCPWIKTYHERWGETEIDFDKVEVEEEEERELAAAGS